MASDPLSDILTITRAEAILTGGFRAGGPWALHFPARDKIKLFAVVQGACWAELSGEAAPMRFVEGDVGLLIAPRPFVLSSALGIAPRDATALFSAAGKTTATLGDGADFAYIGGHVTLDATSGALLRDVLPPWIHIRADSPGAAACRWLLTQLIEEQADERPGARLALDQLTQLLFLQILRLHMKTAQELPSGWMRVMSDPQLAPALRALHGDPARAWHLDELARQCAMSRTTFATQFKLAAGLPPLTYLTQWRMQLAMRALRDTDITIEALAEELGYASSSAFSNAFKRVTGRAPSMYRQPEERAE